MDTPSLSLKQIQAKLDAKPHVLIHLCEKGVIDPDIQQTAGRGLHRAFSHWNLFEFAVALSIRRYGIPVATTAVIVRLLRSFERSTQKRMKGFNMLEYLRRLDADSDLVMNLYDGHYMVFEVRPRADQRSMIGFDIRRVLNHREASIRLERLETLPEHYDSNLRLDLKRLARRVQ